MNLMWLIKISLQKNFVYNDGVRDKMYKNAMNSDIFNI